MSEENLIEEEVKETSSVADEVFAQRSKSKDNPHALVSKGDPAVNGPYLDDIRKAQEDAYRNQRTEALNALANRSEEKNSSEKDSFEQEKETYPVIKSEDEIDYDLAKEVDEDQPELPFSESTDSNLDSSPNSGFGILSNHESEQNVEDNDSNNE